MPHEMLERLNYKEDGEDRQVTGIGFSHVRERIRAAYGSPYGITIESKPDRYTLVTYTLPLIEGTGETGTDEGGEVML